MFLPICHYRYVRECGLLPSKQVVVDVKLFVYDLDGVERCTIQWISQLILGQSLKAVERFDGDRLTTRPKFNPKE